MGYTLNVDLWEWVNPETQKVTKLNRGDEVPAEVLEQDGVDAEQLSSGRNPTFLKDDSEGAQEAKAAKEAPDNDSTNESARTATSGQSSSPKVAEKK
jgi:hypothetical protein